MIFPPPNFTVFWVNLGSMRAPVGLLQYLRRLWCNSTEDSSEKPSATFPASILLAGCGPWQMPHGFSIVFCLVLASGHWFDHGGHFETESDKLFWLTQGLQVTRSRGALLQWKMGWPWIFEPTNGPLEQLSCGVCLTWACQKHLQSLQIFFYPLYLTLRHIEGVCHISSGSGLQPLDNQHFGLRVNLRHVCRGLVPVDVKV